MHMFPYLLALPMHVIIMSDTVLTFRFSKVSAQLHHSPILYKLVLYALGIIRQY